MKVTLLCTDETHRVMPMLRRWQYENRERYDVQILSAVSDITESGDLLFLVSCSEIVGIAVRNLFKHTLVLHASDLPHGRGWSPHIWDVIAGREALTVSLLEAQDPVDTGDIWMKKRIELQGTELYDEINRLVFTAEIQLIDWACENIFRSESNKQDDIQTEYYRRRSPDDSEIDISKSIKDQFDLLRVCDPDRYPAFFKYRNETYKIRIEKFYE